ncbi:hypothetical protein Godav_022309, partial [Gossypium davidsonii]|nr:hypothetical protein [Gossypium davidsonii]
NLQQTANGGEVPFLNINGTNLQILDFDFLKGTIKDLSSFYINMTNRVDSSDNRKKKSCGFASLISDDYDLEDSDISSRTHVPTQLHWGTAIYGECYLNDSSDTSCTSDGEYCWSRLSSNHLCVCDWDTRIYSTLC